MFTEVALFIFALSAVPVSIFVWDIIWGLLAHQRGAVMQGVRTSWKRAIVATVIAVSALFWLHTIESNTQEQIEQRNTELIETITNTNSELKQELIDRLDKLIVIMEANNATGNSTTTK